MPVQYTLKQLEYFVAAAESGTIRAAAERCHISQVGLGVALGDLERALGVQLFIRRRAKGVTTTPEGRSVLAIARAVLARTGELQAVADDVAQEVSGILRIGCHTGLALLLMPDLCDAFVREHPNVKVEFREGSQEQLQVSLAEGELEVALLYERDLPEEVEWERVIEMHPYALVSATHRLSGRSYVSLTELQDDPLIRLSIPPLGQSVAGWGAAQGPATHAYSASSVELVRSLVGRGLGYAVLGQHSPSDTTVEGRPVVELRIEEEIPPVRIVLAYPRGMTLPRRAHAAADFLRRVHGRTPSPNLREDTTVPQ